MNSLFWINSRIEKFGEVMLDLRLLNVEKLLHQFVVNLNSKLRLTPCKRLGKVQFISQVDKTLQVKKEIMSISENMKDTASQEPFDIPDKKSVKHFIEKKIKFLDKHVHHKPTHPLTSNVRNLNKSIEQRVIKSKRHSLRDIKRLNPRLNHGLPTKRAKENTPVEDEELYLNMDAPGKAKQTKDKKQAGQNDSKTCSNATFVKHNKGSRRNNSLQLDRKKLQGPCNPISELTEYTKREIRSSTQFLALCIRDDEFKKRNVHITLYISTKELTRNNRVSDARRDEILVLCQRAMLCSIEPSEKAFVLFKDDLSSIIRNHLAQGYRDHFDCRSNCEQQYSALLILSRWAKILIKDPNNILIRTIAGIINCSADRVLVLSCLQEK